jgi:hypothetical protein
MNSELKPFVFDGRQIRNPYDLCGPIFEPVEFCGYVVDATCPLSPATQVLFRYFLGRKSDTPPAPSFLYVIGSEEPNAIKIGISKDVSARLKAIETSSGKQLKVVRSWDCTGVCIIRQSKKKQERCIGASAFEAVLHPRFSKYRIKGEWFRLPDKDLSKLVNFKNPAELAAFLKLSIYSPGSPPIESLPRGIKAELADGRQLFFTFES